MAQVIHRDAAAEGWKPPDEAWVALRIHPAHSYSEGEEVLVLTVREVLALFLDELTGIKPQLQAHRLNYRDER
jgi:hypothetical protein